LALKLIKSFVLGDIGIYGMAILAYLSYFSFGFSVFSLKNCGITILEILRHTVFAILDSKTAVIDKFACGGLPRGAPEGGSPIATKSWKNHCKLL
jgi:hypothetical protein